MVNWRKFYNSGEIKILLYLQENKEARYSQLLEDVIPTRSILSVALQDLKRLKLVERLVDSTTSPIQTRYRLTEKGTKVVQLLSDLEKLVTQ